MEVLDPKVLTMEIDFPVCFNDCDPMKVVWHGNYINYFEKVRSELLNKIGYGYLDMERTGYLFPVTEVKCKYISSLRFGDICHAKAILTEYENMIKMNFELYNAATGKLTTKGSVSQMCVDAATGESQFVCPKIWIDKVETLIKQGGFQK